MATREDNQNENSRVVRPGERDPSPQWDSAVMAPWSNLDRYPITLGQSLTFQYIGACQRQAQAGYRLQWVDLLRELLRRDPSAYGNLTARILASAGGRLQVVSAAKTFPSNDHGELERQKIRLVRERVGLTSELHSMSDDDRLLADQIAAHVQQQIDRIPRKPQVLAQQLWSIYYGVAANENLWTRTPSEWRLRELHYIHPRRIAYPDPGNWHPHIWDQGLVAPSSERWREYLTQGMYGLDVEYYPNKFLIQVPEVLSGYPTEDGLGFILAWWIAAKIMGARSYMQFVEKYSKPGTIGKYSTKQHDGKPRNATPEDIDIAQHVVQSMGYGGAPGAVIPDSIELELFGPAAMKGSSGTSDPKSFVEWCDDQIARAIRTTSSLQSLQSNGARSAMETLLKGANLVRFYDAMGVSSTWTRDVAAAITRLNYPSLEHLCPAIVLYVDDEPGPEVLLERIKDLVSIGAPVDADKAAAAIGMGHLLAAKGDKEARILYQAKAMEVIPSQQQTVQQDEQSGTSSSAPSNGALDTDNDEEEDIE